MKIKTLGELCDIVSGGTPSRTKEEFWNEGTIPWIKIGNIKGKYVNKADEYITPLGLEKSAAKILPKGTVLYTIFATLGEVGILDIDACTNQAIAGLIIKDANQLNEDYLYYFLMSKKTYVNDVGRGVAQNNINMSILRHFELPLPILARQLEIVDILNKVSAILDVRQQEVQMLDDLIKSRFVEMFGDLADPKCLWSRFKLVDVCMDKDDIKCGPFGTQLNKDEYQQSGIAVWEIPQINASFLTQPTHFLTKEKAEQLKAYTIIPGDIAMSRKGNVGKCALFPDDYPEGIIHSDVLRIRVDHNRVNPLFLMWQLHFSGAVTRQIEMVSSGAIMAGVNVTKLKQIYVHLPPLEYQEKFAEFVRKIGKSKFVSC